METTQSTANSSGPRLPWAGKKVRMEQVEQELSNLWRMSADNVRISQNVNVRTSVLNFVICASSTEAAQQASALIRNLSSTHVARAVVLVLDTTAQAPDALFTWVTLRSFSVISDLMRHSFEQITVLASGSATRATSGILQQLLKPELPVYIWWLHDPPADTELFSNLARLSSRVIVDSGSFFDAEASMNTLSTLIPTLPHSAISDLNWGRLTPWRELVAQFFDAAEYKPYLMGVETIEIEHAVTSTNDTIHTEEELVLPNATRALLLAAWLKARLGWQFLAEQFPATSDSTTGTYSWQMVRNARPSATRALSSGTGRTGKLRMPSIGTIDIRPRVEPDLPPGTLCLVRLSSSVENRRATFTINRGEDLNHVVTLVELPQGQGIRPQRTVSMAVTHDMSELLHDELEIMGRDYQYEETLQEVSELLA
jgi:glucose-6-phosphate dehydrogenase assembly protein OpcA